MFRIIKITFSLATMLILLGACNEQSGTKSLDEVEQSQGEEIDPSLIKDNRTAGKGDPTNPEPKFQFKQTNWDFGTVTEGMRPTYVYKFTNVGNTDLVISSCQASCGCTTPKWTEKPVPPGGEGEIHVAFNSTGRLGIQHKEVTITANTNPPKTVLTLTGTVEKK